MIIYLCILDDTIFNDEVVWHDNVTRNNQKHFAFDDEYGIQDNDLYEYSTPAQFYLKFLSDDLLDVILSETNKYKRR